MSLLEVFFSFLDYLFTHSRTLMAPLQGQEPSRVEARFTTTRLKGFYLKEL